MKLHRSFMFLYLTCSCQAGPLIGLAAWAAEWAVASFGAGEIAGEAAAQAVLESSLAGAFGVGFAAEWSGQLGFIVVDGALYTASQVVPVGVLAGAGAVAGGVYAAVTDAKVSKSLMASAKSEMSVVSVSAESASKASVSSVKSAKSVISKHTSATHALSKSASQARASVLSQASAIVAATFDTKNSPFTFTSKKPSKGKRSGTINTTPSPTTSIPTPPGTPVSHLPEGSRPAEVPAGVPQYNFRMCQYDIIKMGQNKQNITFDQPKPQSILVGNVPSTCMVLATVILGDPSLGPHPIPMGADKLQWDDIHPDTITLIRGSFGLPSIDPGRNATQVMKDLMVAHLKKNP